ncbi:GTPase Era [Clostridia bacterium]|nr:GTPase Era [Clostridia bacterium]
MQKTIYTAIIGAPNAGKSTLLNTLAGTKIAIVSGKPQTTRVRINGIVTKDDTQFVFVDTPGMHPGVSRRKELNRRMNKEIHAAIGDVDVCLIVVDAARALRSGNKLPAELSPAVNSLRELGLPAVLLLNKVDIVREKESILSLIDTLKDTLPWLDIVPVSAAKSTGTDVIFKILSDNSSAVEGEKPLFVAEGFTFDPDLATDQSERFFLSELLREKLLAVLSEEIPHGIDAEVESIEDGKTSAGEPLVKVGLVLSCHKQTHKGIIIGKGGAVLKKCGAAARAEMEEYFGCKVHMSVFVKVRKKDLLG